MNKRIAITCLMSLAVVFTASAQDDDLYFTPKKKAQKAAQVAPAVVRPYNVTVVNAASPSVEVYNSNSRDDDEYNRRSNYAGTWQTSGGADGDTLAAEIDTLYGDSKYDLSDPELDYAYSRRILRFHSPRVGLYVSSPYYWDLVYGYGVYDYFYDPFYYDYYNPFYWNYGWGYGYTWGPWASWYSPLWGWYGPRYHWATWGYGPSWHGTSHVYYASRNIGPRTSGIGINRAGRGTNIRTSALAANSSSRSTGISLARTTPRTNATATLRQRTEGRTLSPNLAQASTNSRQVGMNGRTSAVRSNSTDGRRPSSTRISVNQRAENGNQTTTTTQQRTSVQRQNTTTTQRTTTTQTRPTTTPSRTTTPSMNSGASRGGGGFTGGGMSRGGGGSMGGGMSRGGGRR